jgi:hypothetical protein
MWKTGGKHIHAHGHGGKQNSIDTASDRLIFYDTTGSTTYDLATGSWYRDGQPFTPTFPLTFTLEDGRTVTANVTGKGGKVKWQIQ